MPPYDLLIRGGELIDPASGLRGKRDLAIIDDRIVAIEPELPLDSAAQVVSAQNDLVVPGLIDLHTHLGFEIHRQVVSAEQVCPSAGVTAAVDMGSTGAFTFPWYRERVLERCSVRLLAFINMSSIGTIAIHNPYYVDYYVDGAYLDVEDTARTIEENRDYIRGIKVFGTSRMVGQWALPALRAARQVADAVDVPIAVHVSVEPPTLEEILALLRPGDIITRSYTPLDQGILDSAGRIRPAVREARERGVLFDLGHGAGSFSFETARKAMAQDFLPDCISTDVYSANTESPVKDMTTTLGKFLNLGLSLEEILSRVTINPAQAIGRPDLGRLQVGGPADVSVLSLQGGRYRYIDSRKEILEGPWQIACKLAVCRGQVIFQQGQQDT
jgi:dihydroorotase